MAITPLTTPAPSTSDPTNFDARADILVAELPIMVTEINVAIASMNAISAGGAMAIPYTFSTTTTDADPGAGFLRLDNATQNTATTIRADLVGADTTTWTDVLDSFDDSSSTVKGFIRLVNIADSTKWLIFSVSSISSPSGYRNIVVAAVASSSASPLVNNDSIILYFTRNGDVGLSQQIYAYNNFGGF